MSSAEVFGFFQLLERKQQQYRGERPLPWPLVLFFPGVLKPPLSQTMCLAQQHTKAGAKLKHTKHEQKVAQP